MQNPENRYTGTQVCPGLHAGGTCFTVVIKMAHTGILCEKVCSNEKRVNRDRGMHTASKSL